jgi:hypothetical protein
MASGILAAIAALIATIYSVVAGQQGPIEHPPGFPDSSSSNSSNSIEQRVGELKQAIREFVEKKTANIVPDQEAPLPAPPLAPAPQAPARGCAHSLESGPGWVTSTTTCTSTTATGSAFSVAQSVTSSSINVTVQTDMTR